ncbi:MAG: ABC transporter permease [Candidatus Saccharibacteria bacterium]|nr:ABC transporter permease [Candidatus Saccharibacteria bacterium]
MNRASSSIFKVMKFETMRQLKKPAFWAATFLVPLMIGVIYFISFVSAQSHDVMPDFDENARIMITDDAGVFSETAPFIINGDRDYGIEKLKEGEADLYFYIPADFVETKKAEFYHISEGLEIFNNDKEILKQLLIRDAALRVGVVDTMILTGGFEVNDNKLTSEGVEANALGRAVVPFAIGVIFFMFITLCGNRFLFTVVEEKENRISEMILTDISSKHLIIGKILALLILGLIQIIVLVVPILIWIFVKRDDEFLASILSTIEIRPLSLILSLGLLVMSIVFYAGLCVFVGSLVSTARDASSFIGPVIVAMVLPLYFMGMFMEAKPSLVIQILTYFPISAPIAMMLRNGFGTLSTLELCVGLGIVTISAVVMIWLAIKTFQKNAINFNIAKPKFLRRKK